MEALLEDQTESSSAEQTPCSILQVQQVPSASAGASHYYITTAANSSFTKSIGHCGPPYNNNVSMSTTPVASLNSAWKIWQAE